MTQLPATQSFGKVSTRFAGVQASGDDLGAGVFSSYGVLSYAGKEWSVRYRGEKKFLPNPRELDVVILKASANLSKIWYEGGFVPGSNAKPDCYSTNGIRPEPNSPKLQNDVCATCKRNVWGSAINRDTGLAGKGKDCRDSRRLAVVPIIDPRNEIYGGPMLLRVPADSLQDLAQFDRKMAALGYKYFTYATRISFKQGVNHPKFEFMALRELNDDEADIILELRDSREAARVIGESEFTEQAVPPAEKKEEPKGPFLQAKPTPQAPKPAAKVEAKPAPKQEAAPPVADEAAPATPAFEDALEALMPG